MIDKTYPVGQTVYAVFPYAAPAVGYGIHEGEFTSWSPGGYGDDYFFVKKNGGSVNYYDPRFLFSTVEQAQVYAMMLIKRKRELIECAEKEIASWGRRFS